MSFATDAAERLTERLHFGNKVVPLGHPLRFLADLKGSEVYFKALGKEWRRNKQPITLAQKLRLA